MNKAKLTFTTAFLALLLFGPTPYQGLASAVSAQKQINDLKTAVTALQAEVEALKSNPSTAKQVVGFDEVCIENNNQIVTIFTVPAGKTFILTDLEIIGGGGQSILRQIESTPKVMLTSLSSQNPYVVHFQSGYNFPGGSQIQFSSTGGCVRVSGYLVSS